MNRLCYFLDKKAIFGSYPSQETVELLEKEGVRWFIDLTTQKDNLVEYNTIYNKIKYPIIDHNCPKDWFSFTKLLYRIKYILDNLNDYEKIYIHCRGGHGRSSTVSACILSFILNKNPEESLKIVNECHKKRIDMSEKSRLSIVPNKIKQISFVYKYFTPLLFYSNAKDSRFLLSINSNHKIYIDNMYFSNCDDAIYFFIKNNTEKNGSLTKFEIIEKILLLKINQHHDVYTFLIRTGMRPIIDLNIKYTPNNIIGEVYIKIRNEIYNKSFESSLS